MKTSSIILLVGISGCGKSTFCTTTIHKYLSIKKLIAVTTRPSRQHEVNGVDKHFMTQKEFKNKETSNCLCLIYEAYGYLYAFYKYDFLTGDTYIGELNYNNYADFKKYCHNVTTIYIRPCDIELAVLGLKNRGSCTNEVSNRIKGIYDEQLELDYLYSKGQFNYKFINNYDDDSKIRFEKLTEKILCE